MLVVARGAENKTQTHELTHAHTNTNTHTHHTHHTQNKQKNKHTKTSTTINEAVEQNTILHTLTVSLI